MKVIMNCQPEPQIQHFNHTHPLMLLNIQQLGLQQQLASSCACCKLKVVPTAAGTGGTGIGTGDGLLIYSCIPCNYFLHMSCSGMPQQITHPFDRENHVLVLVPTPTYADGVFNCDACMKHGNGFSYHCAACKIDLHANCASLPMIQPHHSHPHPLTLSFTVPAGPTNSTKSFVCGICHQIGYKEWLYLCTPCSFAAHLGCATAKPRPPPPPAQLQQALQQAAVAGGAPYSPRHQQFQQPNMNTNYNANGTMIQQQQQQSTMKPSMNKGQLGKAIVNTALTALIGFPVFNNNPSSQSQKQSQPRHQPQPQRQFVGDGGGVYVGSPGGQNMNQNQFFGGGRGGAAVYARSTGGANNFNHQQQQYMGGGRGGGRGVYVGSPAGASSFDQNQYMGRGRVVGRGAYGNNLNYQQQFVGGGRGGGTGVYGGPAGGGGAYGGPAGGGPYTGPAGGSPYNGPAGGDPYGGPAGGGNEPNYSVNLAPDFGSSTDCSSTTDPSYTVEYSTDTANYYYDCGTGGGDVVRDASYSLDPTFTTDFSFGDSSYDCNYLI